jgi:hypothetical protein
MGLSPERPVGNGDRKPIVLLAQQPTTKDEIDALRAYVASFPWPILVVDYRWTVLT